MGLKKKIYSTKNIQFYVRPEQWLNKSSQVVCDKTKLKTFREAKGTWIGYIFVIVDNGLLCFLGNLIN